VDDAGDFAFELGFDGDDKAIAANGDEVILSAAAFRERAERFAEALFNGAMLAFHCAANAAKFVRGVVVERAIGFDFAAEKAQEGGEIVMQEWRGEFGDARPVVSGGAGGWIQEIAPGGYLFDYVEKMEDFEGFQSRAFNASFFEEAGGVEETCEAKAAAAGEHSADLGGPLLLLINPGEFGGGFEGENPGSAERGGGAGGNVVAEARPLKRLGAGFNER
jgi:hypothetical protein